MQESHITAEGKSARESWAVDRFQAPLPTRKTKRVLLTIGLEAFLDAFRRLSREHRKGNPVSGRACHLQPPPWSGCWSIGSEAASTFLGALLAEEAEAMG